MNERSNWHSLIEKLPPEYIPVEIQTRDGIRRARFDPLEWHDGWLLQDCPAGAAARCRWADGRQWRPLNGLPG
ncbi:hypothetical protein HPT27_10660 [Permianibacter sp. IMCC34836]|uniref:hypothetical protein n=1 Tax=Permianibacter fluminis TaxID=2738515 RepID=UPI001551E15C|nr:hypothetical protein [Permianibacter fluminis]NQD37489.1 hypothetical protein [Permianibacter fluminis]